MKDNNGKKLAEHPNIENEVIGWLVENPKLSNYAIVTKLKEKFDFKITAPSIKNWKNNFFKKFLEVKKKLETDAGVSNIDFDRFTCLRDYQKDLDSLIDRRSKIEQYLKTREVKSSDNKDAFYFNAQAEYMYRDYTNQILVVRDKFLKHLGEISPYSIFQEIMEDVVKNVLVLFTKAKAKKNNIPNK